MQPVRFLPFIALALAASVSLAGGPPNVVLIVSDDQGWTDFGFMGHKVIKTPHLDRLASQSLVLENGYVPTPLCRPSLATILTGRYPHQHMICCNDPPEGVEREAEYHLMQDAPTIPRLLKQAGYRSLQTGKFWEGHYSHGGFTDGITEKGRHGDAGLVIGRRTMQPIYDFIESSKGKPFFVWYAPMLPHNPHNPPARILKKYQKEGRPETFARYFAMCEWFDQTCGELLKYLDERKLTENTIVLFVVDNGWIQDKEAESPIRSKLTPYDGGLRTPIMVRWPGRVEPRRVKDLASSIDLAPTILAACQVEPPAGLPGVNLLKLADGQAHLERKAVFGEVFVHTAVKLDTPAASVTHRWVREGDWKLILPVDSKVSPELYDLGKDPAEEKNLAQGHADKVGHLTELLDGWWKVERR